MEALKNNREVQKIPHIKQMVDAFLSKEIVSSKIDTYDLQKFELFSPEYENNQIHKDTLRRMLLQHNIRVMSLYYNIVNLSRMSNLIGGSNQETEDELCALMAEKLVNCKIDRLEGIIGRYACT